VKVYRKLPWKQTNPHSASNLRLNAPGTTPHTCASYWQLRVPAALDPPWVRFLEPRRGSRRKGSRDPDNMHGFVLVWHMFEELCSDAVYLCASRSQAATHACKCTNQDTGTTRWMLKATLWLPGPLGGYQQSHIALVLLGLRLHHHTNVFFTHGRP